MRSEMDSWKGPGVGISGYQEWWKGRLSVNYRLGRVEREGLVDKTLVVIVGACAGQERYAGALPNFTSDIPNTCLFSLSVEEDKQGAWYAT